MRGMQQQYHLGQLLRKRYVTNTSFLTENYTRTEVHVRSTDYDRTLMSAQSLLAALFPAEGNRRVASSVGWQPIPVHTIPQSEDILLRGYETNCPRYSELRESDKQTEEYRVVEVKHRNMFKKLENYTGVEAVNLTNIWDLQDTLFVENVSGYGLPEWLGPKDMEILTELSVYTLHHMFNTLEKKRLVAGEWVGKILTDMQGKANGDQLLNDSKLFLYSAHDTSVAIMMDALGVWDCKLPPYASAFLVELINDKEQYSVELYYRGDTFSDDIRILKVPGCSRETRCTLEEFEAIAKPLLSSESRQKECGVDSSGAELRSSSGSDSEIILGVLFAGSCLVMAGLVVALGCVCQRKGVRYRELITVMEVDSDDGL